MSKNTFKRCANLLLAGEEGKRYYPLIKDFNTFMYCHALNRGGKHVCRYILQAFSFSLVNSLVDDSNEHEKQRV